MRRWKATGTGTLGRKPLKDVSNRHESNGGRLSKKAPLPPSSSSINGTSNNNNNNNNNNNSNNNNNNNNNNKDDETTPFVSKRENDTVLEGEEECPELDRLLLVHSHISSLTRQIDELVSKTMKLNRNSNKGRKEIESFTLFLSHMISSLKPWVPRFDEVLSLPSSEMENQAGDIVADRGISVVDEVDNLEVGTPEETTMDSLISPSPLVSWRADCHIEQGRQLFLLTPLPTPKAPSQKRCDLSQLAVQMFAPTPTVEIPLQFPVSRDTDGDLPEGPTIKRTPTKLDSVATEVRSTFTCGILSTPLFVKRDRSVLVVTPCLKMSPPKSCVMLEPISESSRKVHDNVRKSTPFPVGVHSTISESSSGERSEDLGAKYPELLGIQRSFLTRTGTYIDTSPDWSFSPPKTCVLLEPPTGKEADVVARDCRVSISAPIVDEQTNLSLKLKDFDATGVGERNKIPNEDCRVGSLAHIECTPIWKEAGSTMRTGRHPGENTLKRELWTKFEAASTYGLQLNVSAFQGTAKKGFLDMLDEVSCDGESVMPEGLK